MKKLLALVLTLTMLFTFTACGKNTDNNEPNGTAGNDSNQNVSAETTKGEETPAPTQPTEATLETTKVRLLCADENYMALAILDAPQTNYGTKICDKDGNSLGLMMMDRYRAMTKDNGLWLVDNENWPSEYGVGDFSVVVTDASGEERSVSEIEPMTPDEMAAYGLFSTNGYGTFAACGDVKNTSYYAEFNVLVYMFCNGGIDTLEQVEEQFKLYAEDGTPLDSFLGGYVLEVSVNAPYVNVRIYQDANQSNFENPDEFVEQLKNSKPYMEYTGTDGTTWKLPLIQEQEEN